MTTDTTAILKTGYVKKKDGSVHMVANYINNTHVRLRYEGNPTHISTLKIATEQEYQNFINNS